MCRLPPLSWRATKPGAGWPFAVVLAIRNAGLDMPGGVVGLSPWADLSLSAGLGSAVPQRRSYLRKSNPCDGYASPAYSSFTAFPPVMVHCRGQ